MNHLSSSLFCATTPARMCAWRRITAAFMQWWRGKDEVDAIDWWWLGAVAVNSRNRPTGGWRTNEWEFSGVLWLCRMLERAAMNVDTKESYDYWGIILFKLLANGVRSSCRNRRRSSCLNCRQMASAHLAGKTVVSLPHWWAFLFAFVVINFVYSGINTNVL